MIETAWLIESKFHHADGRPHWWMGTSHPAPWTADSLRAVRFCRRRDAEAAMLTLPDAHMVFATEHQWGFEYDGPRKPNPVRSHQARIGSRGGSATGKSKKRGSKDYYRKLALKSAKARRTKKRTLEGER